MSGFCLVDSLKELEFKGGEKALSFNILYGVNFEEESYIAITGFRLISGCIHPPKAKRQGNWYSVGYLGKKTALAVYMALQMALEETGRIEKFPLNSPEVAIEELVKNSAIAKFYPKLAGNL